MNTRTLTGTGDEIEREDLVEFRLLFEGELLPSAGSKKRASEKHVIRQSFHPQLRRLWTINSNLRQLAGQYYKAPFPGPNGGNPPIPSDQERFDGGIAKIGENWSRAGFQFVPLVTSDMALRCSIDITILRPEDDRFIFEAGDIDGQLKTLFDALRIPKDAGECGGAIPQADETPFFCLLEDDRLVSEVRVSTDQMLLLPNRREVKANDAHAVIHVKLNHKNARTFDNYFG